MENWSGVQIPEEEVTPIDDEMTEEGSIGKDTELEALLMELRNDLTKRSEESTFEFMNSDDIL